MSEGFYERWRPALAAFAVLCTVVAIAFATRTDNNFGVASNPNIVVDSSVVPLITVPLTRTLSLNVKGDDVTRVQQRLATLHFNPGPIDGVFGQNTVQAVWAFEKLVMGVPRERASGQVTPSTWSIMQSDFRVKPRRKSDTKTHVEIYLPEQILIVFTSDEPILITHISSGSSEPWCEEVTIDPGEEGNDTYDQIKKGICGHAVTPPGIFYFYNRHQGMRESKLGSMYNPVYFNYGIAIHGAILVPLKPVSHGCVRIPMSVARYFPALVAYGDRVYVFDGIKEPEEYGSPVPLFDKPDPNYTTTTSVLPTSVLPTSVLPTSVLPTSVVPTTAVTTTSLPRPVVTGSSTGSSTTTLP